MLKNDESLSADDTISLLEEFHEEERDANLQNQYYGGIVTWIYTLKLGDSGERQMEACHKQ